MFCSVALCVIVHDNSNNDNNNNNNNCIERRNLRFLTISSLGSKLSPARTLKWPGRSCAQIERLSRATCVTRHMVRRDSSAVQFDRVEIAFI